MIEFSKLPSARILNQTDPLLKQFSWQGENKSANIAALMVLTAFVHNVGNIKTAKLGVVRLTYDEICHITSLSRASVSKGIKILLSKNIIELYAGKKTKDYLIIGYDEYPWAKFPAKYMYSKSGEISVFSEFKLRNRIELDALKLFLLLIAFRNHKTNNAMIGYEKITEYTGISRKYIKYALSYLATHHLVQASAAIDENSNGNYASNRYRVCGISHIHEGNSTKTASFKNEMPDFLSS